jgi:type IV pilus assembly protein PilB
VVPVSFANNRLTLAMTNPSNVVAFDDVRRVIKGVLIEPAVVTEDDFKRFMSSYSQLIAADEAASEPQRQPAARPSGAPAAARLAAAPSVDLLESDLIRELQLAADTEDQKAETKQDLMSASEDAPIIKLANSILGLAIRQGASDIHIEPMEADVTVRFRIDGVLQVVQKLPKRVQLGLISRFKILSRLDIAEKRLPQDGRISVSMDAKPIDFRVSTVPGKWGEGVNISTAEDPIEYDLPGVTQIQANPAIGLTFASVLRAFLRQDPDVLLVGETRDKETAKTAVEAALTGHLVFTTLHTNSAAVAFTRLHEMDVEPFLVSSSTIGVIAQRLARRLCQQCKEPAAVDANIARFWGLAEGATIFRAKGCAACGGKGVRGRVGVYEVMRVTPRLRAMIGSAARSEDIHAAAVEDGMIDLKHYSAWLLAEGLTSVEEVTSVVSVDL